MKKSKKSNKKLSTKAIGEAAGMHHVAAAKAADAVQQGQGLNSNEGATYLREALSAYLLPELLGLRRQQRGQQQQLQQQHLLLSPGTKTILTKKRSAASETEVQVSYS